MSNLIICANCGKRIAEHNAISYNNKEYWLCVNCNIVQEAVNDLGLGRSSFKGYTLERKR